VHPTIDVVQREVLASAAVRIGTVVGRGVLLGEGASWHTSDPRRHDEAAVRAGQHLADRLHRRALGAVRGGRVDEVVLVGEMDDRIGRGCAGPQAVEIVEVASVNLSALGPQGGGGRVGAGEADHLVAAGKQLVDGGGTDPAGGSGDEHAHEQILFIDDSD